jgi:4-amino-4-deoxy-L-arabinose transferase-like glycosyltransferase
MRPTLSSLAALMLIVGSAVLRVAYLAFWCPLELAPDEAYYWQWSRQLDWSYHSKGPLVAWLIRLSCECFGDTMLAVRLPAVGCGSLMLLGLFTLTKQIYRDAGRAFLLIALALTLPIVAAGGMLMTIDAPFTCAWTWALVFAHRALFTDSRWAWPAAGVCLLLGILAKATMVLWLPSLALFLVTTPGFRDRFRQAGFWLMCGTAGLGCMPIILWNAGHGWVTLTHTQMHVGLDDDAGIHWLGPLHFLGAQFAVLLGFWFVVWAWSMWRHRPTVEVEPEARFLWWMSMPVVAFFALFSFKNGGGEANWPIVAYLAGMALVGRQGLGVRGWGLGSMAAMCGFAALGLIVTASLHAPVVVQPVLLQIAGPATPERPMPMRRVDPTCRLRGWRHLASEVDRVRTELQACGIEPILAAERWTQASELAFYCEGQPAIYCLGVWLGDRNSQYDLWRPNPCADPGEFTGRTFILVGLEMERLRPAFDYLEPTRTITYCENGEPIAEWTIVVAHGFRGRTLPANDASPGK